METNYKTMFIETVSLGKGMRFKSTVNGDQLARDIQAAIEEMEKNGFALNMMNPVISYKVSGYNTTEGMLVVFRKKPYTKSIKGELHSPKSGTIE